MKQLIMNWEKNVKQKFFLINLKFDAKLTNHCDQANQYCLVHAPDGYVPVSILDLGTALNKAYTLPFSS